MSERDGGPAFPGGVNSRFTKIEEGEPTQPGMTLRDYFAAQVMAGIAEAPGETCDGYIDQRVRVAYKIADAMLKERAK